MTTDLPLPAERSIAAERRAARPESRADASLAPDPERRALWSETLWSIGLVGSVLLVIAVLAQFV